MNEKPWVAYSCCAGMDEFDTQEEAEAWVLEHEQDDECCPDACSGSCFVARLVSRTEFVPIEDEHDSSIERGYLQFVGVNKMIDHIPDATKMVPVSSEQLFPCVRCGVFRTEAQGGDIVTVCDECWDRNSRGNLQ